MKETLNRIKVEALEAIASPETDDAALEALRIKRASSPPFFAEWVSSPLKKDLLLVRLLTR